MMFLLRKFKLKSTPNSSEPKAKDRTISPFQDKISFSPHLLRTIQYESSKRSKRFKAISTDSPNCHIREDDK